MTGDVTPFDEEPRPAEEQSEERDWDQDRSRRGRYRYRPSSWLWGLILVAAGIVFLLETMGFNIPALENWWALFILIPAVGAFARAGRAYADNGKRVNGVVTGALIAGLAMTMVVVTFLFGLSWNLMLPIFLILGGLGTLFTAIGVR
jgi:hypothetical protein